MSDINPFVNSKQQSQEAVQASGIVLAEVEDVSDDGSMAAVSNVGKEAKYPARVPEEAATPPIGSSVLVNTAASGQPFIQQTMQTPEGESLSAGSTTYTTDTRPPESEASRGDHWLDVLYYRSPESWSVSGSSGNRRFASDGNNFYTYISSSIKSYNIDDGAENWSTTSGFSASQTYDTGEIYFGDTDGPSVRSISSIDGSDVWSNVFSDFARTVISDDSNVYASFRTFDGTHGIRSLDKSDGSVNWERDVGDFGTEGDIVYDASNIYHWFGDDVLRSISKVDGSTSWSHGFSSTPSIYYTISGGNIYIGTNDGGVFSIDTSDGSVNWNNNSISSAVRSVGVDSTHVYAAGTGGLWKMDKSDGSIVWNISTTMFGNTQSLELRSDISVSGDYIYIACHNTHNVYKISKSGNERWIHVQPSSDIEALLRDGSIVGVTGQDNSDGFRAITDERSDGVSETYVFDGDLWIQTEGIQY